MKLRQVLKLRVRVLYRRGRRWLLVLRLLLRVLLLVLLVIPRGLTTLYASLNGRGGSRDDRGAGCHAY